jgi:hypothetical protein
VDALICGEHTTCGCQAPPSTDSALDFDDHSRPGAESPRRSDESAPAGENMVAASRGEQHSAGTENGLLLLRTTALSDLLSQ